MLRSAGLLPSRKRKPDAAPPVQSFVHHLDSCTLDGVAGWVLHPAGIRSVEVLVDGRPIEHVDRGRSRPDVGRTYPDYPGAAESGFSAHFPKGTFASGSRNLVTIAAQAGDGDTLLAYREVWAVKVDHPASLPARLPTSPLPAEVMVALAGIAPDTYSLERPWEGEAVESALADMVSLLRTRAFVAPVLRYARYLHAMSVGFRYVNDHFDPINHLSDPTAKDYSARATSPEEMLSISNHLYVLQSRGVLASVIECGCFKGFSTCCLSQACAWLGVPMHVFDSFAGLPPSASDYYAEGDFRAPMDEVAGNVRTFGQLDVVTFHKGFFSETLPPFDGPVGCIWMDVDLESSARDVMALLPLLPAESCVFSHEMPPEAFAGDELRPDQTEVLPPLVDAFTASGKAPAGQHLAGLVGLIRAAASGLPALTYEQIAPLVAAAEQ